MVTQRTESRRLGAKRRAAPDVIGEYSAASSEEGGRALQGEGTRPSQPYGTRRPRSVRLPNGISCTRRPQPRREPRPDAHGAKRCLLSQKAQRRQRELQEDVSVGVYLPCHLLFIGTVFPHGASKWDPAGKRVSSFSLGAKWKLGPHQKVRSSGRQSHHYRATTLRTPSSIHRRQRAIAPIPILSLRRGILGCSW